MGSVIRALAIIVSAIFVYPPLTNAQETTTVGDVLAKGGKKLSKDEIQRLYAGATVSGQQAGNVTTTFQNQYLPNGSVSGNAWRNGAFLAKMTGTWHVTDDGKFCNDLNNNVHSCLYMFVSSNRFYAAASDTTSSPAYERQINR